MKNFIKNLLIIFLLVIFFYIYYRFIFVIFRNKKRLEDDIIISENIKNSPFSVSKLIVYSSGYGENQNTNFQKNNWILNISQYSDIAIYINHVGEELNASNTVKKLSLENIRLSSPRLGSPSLYYLDSLNFGTSNFNENYKIVDSIEFTVLNDENKNNDIQSNTPVFFTDCSNPITLKYVNSSIKENYTVTSNEPIFFDGRLLQMADIPLNDLETNLQFSIHLVNHENKDFYYDISIPIDLEDEEKSVYDGNILIEKEFENSKFLERF